MTNVVLIGHGGYGTAMLRNMKMLVGEQPGFYPVDFDESDDLNILRERLAAVIAEIGENEDILFCCDLVGGSPFREAAAMCLERTRRVTVAGLNTSAYTEMSFNLELSPSELAEMGTDTAKQAIMRFPPLEN